MGFSSVDNFISEVTAGKFWRADFMKLLDSGVCIAGNCYDLWKGNGTIPSYLPGNLVKNFDFVSSQVPWLISTGTNWTYTAATHLMTRVANADVASIYQTIPIQAGCAYMVTYALGWTAGTFTISLGGTNGTARGSAATFREIIVAGSTDKTVRITPNATGAGTVDLVSVQPVGGGFIPYSDATEGSFWHGGNVWPDTKHLVNMAAWVNAASVPNVVYLLDVLGVWPRIKMDKTANTIHAVSSNSIKGITVHDCQSDWNEQTPANTAHSLVTKTTEGVTGGSVNTSCVKCTVSNATFTTGVVASKVVALATTCHDYTYAKYLQAWVRPTITLGVGDISLSTDESANLASPQNHPNPIILPANTWTRVLFDVSGDTLTDKDTVISLGMIVLRDRDQAFSVYWDQVEWVSADYVLSNGTFTGNATGWNVNPGWVYGSNNIRHISSSGNILEQTSINAVAGSPYYVTYTLASGTAGTVQATLGGTAGTINTYASGEYSEIINCGTGTTFTLTPSSNYDGVVDDIMVEPLIPRSDAGLANYGVGNRFYYVIDNVLSNGAQTANVDIRYTNASGSALSVDPWWVGTHNRSLGGTVINMSTDVVAHLPHTGVGAGKYGPFLPFQAGDTGVQTVDTLAFSGAATNADSAVDVVICRPICSIPITTAQVVCERDLMNQLPSLPRIKDGACLQLLHLAGMVTVQGTAFQGYCDFAWS